MNYGYYKKNFYLDISKHNEEERYPLQLYHHTATQIDISGSMLLEVGSGRGGGAVYIQENLKTSSLVGLDISMEAVNLCNTSFNVPNLSFVQGDSEKMPFENEKFDVVLNIESSHCYGNINKFLSEVKRVLKINGVFLWCDFRTHVDMEQLFKTFQSSGFYIQKEKDITKNILSALEKMTPVRKKQIKKYVPKLIQPVFKSYAGIQGGDINNAFLKGQLIYKSATLKTI